MSAPFGFGVKRRISYATDSQEEVNTGNDVPTTPIQQAGRPEPAGVEPWINPERGCP